MELLLAGVAASALVSALVLVLLVLAVRTALQATWRRGTAIAGSARNAGLRLSGGPRAEVATLRAAVAQSVAAAADCLDEAQRAGTPVGDVPDLLHRLRAAAADVDAELRALDRLLATSSDPEVAHRRLPATRSAVGLVRDGARDLCDGLVVAARSRDGALAALRDSCRAEAAALQEGARSARLA